MFKRELHDNIKKLKNDQIFYATIFMFEVKFNHSSQYLTISFFLFIAFLVLKLYNVR